MSSQVSCHSVHRGWVSLVPRPLQEVGISGIGSILGVGMSGDEDMSKVGMSKGGGHVQEVGMSRG